MLDSVENVFMHLEEKKKWWTDLIEKDAVTNENKFSEKVVTIIKWMKFYHPKIELFDAIQTLCLAIK
jgi:hypothetical protein